MTYEMMMATLEALGEDVSFDVDDMVFDVTLQDFEGFDEDWSEVSREYDHPDAVDAFLEMLETECESSEGDFYFTYHFDGFDVELGYASYDI